MTSTIIVTGAGGVGKTTLSAALGAAISQRGRSTLVLTIDPAKRLADALGIPNQWFVASNELIGGRHKFDDYYSIFDIEPEPIRLPRASLATLCEGYARTGLEGRKQALIESFPFR